MGGGAVILIIVNDPQIRRLLRTNLQANGYKVKEAIFALEGLWMASSAHPDLIILERTIPDMDSLYIVKKIREWSKTPIIILSEKIYENEEEKIQLPDADINDYAEDKIQLLDAGADDYIIEPFSINELIARIHVSLCHSFSGLTECLYHSGDLFIDFSRRTAVKKDKLINLTTIEFAILRILAQHQGLVLPQEKIMHDLWGPSKTHRESYMRVNIAHIRKKIENDPAHPKLLVSERGSGYRLI